MLRNLFDLEKFYDTGVFDSGKHFLPVTNFAVWRELSELGPLWGCAPSLPAKIRLGWKCLPYLNTIDSYNRHSIAQYKALKH
jgi:hypothetical protein